MPILKQLVSGSSQSKRRSRLDLTAEMISAPLGDFRHTMHVGRGGDTFGDTSFLSSRSGEPPRAADSGAPRSPRPSLLSRTFRSSKRSQSVTRVDRCANTLAPLAGSPTLVKNAFSLPHLNDEDEDGDGDGRRVPKSASSSPMKPPSEADGRSANGPAALDPEQAERSFGELTELRVSSAPRGGGAMRRTESVMSFHVDLGPSMLGDILDVMEKEDDDLGGEEGGTAPPIDAQEEGDQEEDLVEEEKEEEEGDSQEPTVQPPVAETMENPTKDPCVPETEPTHPENYHLDSCSLSSSGSAPLEEMPPNQLQGGEADSSPTQGEEESFSFMEEEDDEIRV